MDYPVSLDDVKRAALAISDITVTTPLLENPDVNDMLGIRLLVKAENMQRTGAFKIRGAANRILQMTPDEKACGVVTYSSGNHGLGVARAAQLLGTSAMIVMPSDAPESKKVAVQSLGAEVHTYERDTQDYNEVVEALRRDTGRIHVPPSADPRVMAGAGTTALEIFEQANTLGASIDAVLIPCGSGGLTAATAIVMSHLSSPTNVYAVEPDQFDDTRRSLLAGERIPNPPGRRTICDAIMTPIPNPMTFPVNRALLAGALTATDPEVCEAMQFAFEQFSMVVEPGAAVGIAAVLSNKTDWAGKTVVTVATGGNVDPARFFGLIGCGQDTTFLTKSGGSCSPTK